jgi:hypothetical protein
VDSGRLWPGPGRRPTRPRSESYSSFCPYDSPPNVDRWKRLHKTVDDTTVIESMDLDGDASSMRLLHITIFILLTISFGFSRHTTDGCQNQRIIRPTWTDTPSCPTPSGWNLEQYKSPRTSSRIWLPTQGGCLLRRARRHLKQTR